MYIKTNEKHNEMQNQQKINIYLIWKDVNIECYTSLDIQKRRISINHN
jgi:hypothetical protein